jgi:hypothetical protein
MSYSCRRLSTTLLRSSTAARMAAVAQPSRAAFNVTCYQQQQFTTLATAASAFSNKHDEYISPLQDLLDEMDSQRTALGTTSPVQQDDKKLACGLAESALRFVTTSYGRTLHAPHVHINEHRVALQLHHQHLDFLSDVEKEIVREIIGPGRYGDYQLKMSSNQFGSRIENKRHLVSMLDRIILSAQRLSREMELEGTQTKKINKNSTKKRMPVERMDAGDEVVAEDENELDAEDEAFLDGEDEALLQFDAEDALYNNEDFKIVPVDENEVNH